MVSTGPYAQWCVMRKAHEEVTVLLDGQGGDELLAGYVPYQFVYLRQLLRDRAYGRFVAEAWTARDVLWPLLRRRLGALSNSGADHQAAQRRGEHKFFQHLDSSFEWECEARRTHTQRSS